MSTTETLLAARFAATRVEDGHGDWDDVLNRAAQTRSRHVRRAIGMAAAVVVAALVAVVTVTPAFGIRDRLHDLFEGAPATPAVLHTFEVWNSLRGWQPGTPPPTPSGAQSSLSTRFPAVDPSEAHGVLRVDLDGGTASLWAAPLQGGGECAIYQTTDANGNILGGSWGGGESWCVTPATPGPPMLFGEHGLPSNPSNRVIPGKAPGATHVQLTFTDGHTVTAPVVEGYFIVPVTGPASSPQTTPAQLRSYDAQGNLVGQFTPVG